VRKAMLLLAVFGFVGLIWAAGPFDGTWKTDPSKTQYSGRKPEVLLLQNGVYQTTSSTGEKVNFKADGTDQPAPPEAKTYDTRAYKIVDDKTLESTTKKDGKVIGSGRYTVSADGKTMTIESTNNPEAGKQPETYKTIYARVAAGPPGSHAISGTWQIQMQNVNFNLPESMLLFTYKSTPNGLVMSNPSGGSFDAKFDGKDYPIKGFT